MTEDLQLQPINIQNKIYTIRGQKVMLDFDLAEIYGVQTKVLNQAVKRNIARFPEDFMSQINKVEIENLRSRFVTSSWGGSRYMPYEFLKPISKMFLQTITTLTKIPVCKLNSLTNP